MIRIRVPRSEDLPLLAAIYNGSHEPHFHRSSTTLGERITLPGIHVAEQDGIPVGFATWATQDFDRADRIWVDLAVHLDAREGDAAAQLIDTIADQAIESAARSLWLSVREDYLPIWPDPVALGFGEVHRTFGGGFFLNNAVSVRALAEDISIVPLREALAAGLGDQVDELYRATRADKVIAPPTIEASPKRLDFDCADQDGSVVAVRNGACVGLAVAEPAPLGAWLAVLVVLRDHRRHRIGRSMLQHVMAALRIQDCSFLKTAGVGSDAAYLATLRSLGAAIEPSWIAYERVLASTGTTPAR